MAERQHSRAPAPTPGPSRQLLKRGLEARQEFEACGYVTDAPGPYSESILNLPLYCTEGFGCFTNTYLGAAGCCGTDENISFCTLYTQCLDRTKFGAAESVVGPYTTYCPDPIDQYCADVFYTNHLVTFLCLPSPSQTYYASLGDVPPSSASATGTTPAATSTIRGSSTGTSPGQKQIPATPSMPTSPATTPVLADASSPLSPGAVVGIAFAGALLILGALGIMYLMRRSKVKMAETRLRETNFLRQSFEDHQHGQQGPGGPPRGSMNTASRIAGPPPPPMSPEPGMTGYPSSASTGTHLGYNHRPGTLDDRGPIPDNRPSYIAPTEDGTFDHSGTPRVEVEGNSPMRDLNVNE